MCPNFERESARCAREGCGRRILRPPSLEFQFLFSHANSLVPLLFLILARTRATFTFFISTTSQV